MSRRLRCRKAWLQPPQKAISPAPRCGARGCEDERLLVCENPLYILGERDEVRWKKNGEVGAVHVITELPPQNTQKKWSNNNNKMRNKYAKSKRINAAVAAI